MPACFKNLPSTVRTGETKATKPQRTLKRLAVHFKSCLHWKLFLCLYNGDKAEVMITVKKKAFAVTTCIILPSRNMGIYMHTYLSLY